MAGVRILEVAEHTFVPAASALLAEWGAEVIKIEHHERGDAMRGLGKTGVMDLGGGVHVLNEHSNRGKKSLGLNLKSEEGREVLYKLAETADVFLINKMPSVVKALQIDEETITAKNPKIIYVRGSGQGPQGPDADKGSYDSLGYWARAGVALGCTPPGEEPTPPPAPAFGDSIGAMTIAGGIMGALFHRERSGEACSVDVSLLSTGIWSMGAAIALGLQLDMPWRGRPPGSSSGNPLTHVYKTSDERHISLTCLQAAKYWPEAAEVIAGQPELATDERFADAAAIGANAGEAIEILQAAFASKTFEEWKDTLESFSGQWAPVQDCIEAVADPQVVANNYILDYETAEGTPFRLASPPVHFGGVAPTAKRAPEFNEHGDDLLQEIGYDWDKIVDLKINNVVA